MKRIYLIRHGQTVWNVEGRWQGQLDVPLSDMGLEQAQALADHMKERPITTIYSSDLERAWTTAKPLAEARGIEIYRDTRLRELHLGVFQGLTHDEIRTKYPDEEQAMLADYMDYALPKGESRRQLQARGFEIWQEIVERETGSEFAIFSHGGTIRLLLMKLFPDEIESMTKVPISNTSVTTVEADGNGLRLIRMAELAHLDGILHTESP